MYTNEDLESAIKNNIFTKKSVNEFKTHINNKSNSEGLDEENFRLVTSFNDIFVVIAITLLLVSSAWIVYKFEPYIAALIVTILSWLLSEFFVLKRKMAFPAIVLLLYFSLGVFATTFYVIDATVLALEFKLNNILTYSSFSSALFTWVYWKRFGVPITIALALLLSIVGITSILIDKFPILSEYFMTFYFVGGMIMFLLAMYWDTQDLNRKTYKSDVAFWLHLSATPLLVHPIFTSLGIFDGDVRLNNLIIIITLYVFLTLVSLIIDRRSFMVSTLIYVLIAINKLFDTFGMEVNNFAFTSIFIGASLLVVSALWHKIRSKIVLYLPNIIKSKIPSI